MTIQAGGGPQLPFRVDPILLESPLGYLCRVAQVYSYSRPYWLLQLAGLSPKGGERGAGASRIAHALRLEPKEWLAMCYRPVARPRRWEQRSFCGRPVGADLPASGIHRFSSQYVSIKALAQQLRVAAERLRRHLKRSGTPMLAIPVGTRGKSTFS